jgi:hypothetical protein
VKYQFVAEGGKMAKRIKKPPIKVEQRREWLRRYEEDGELPPQIAAKDGFDIRTVRRQIELAKEERESREARTIVLRNALEKHYDDLRKFAEKLNAQVLGTPNVPVSQDDDLFEFALRQHLPRSPIWGYLSKRRDLQEKAEQQRKKLDSLITYVAKTDRRLASLTDKGLEGVVPGVTEVLIFETKQWLNGNAEHTLKDSLRYEPAGEGFVTPHIGFSNMGVMEKTLAEKVMPTVQIVVGDLEPIIRETDDYQDLVETNIELTRLSNKLREELAVIRLRRIIPGRCKFCPL